jgi:hypothetical protein
LLEAGGYSWGKRLLENDLKDVTILHELKDSVEKK